MKYIKNVKGKENLFPSDLDGEIVKVISDFNLDHKYVEIMGSLKTCNHLSLDCLPVGVLNSSYETFGCAVNLTSIKRYLESVLKRSIDISVIYAGRIVINPGEYNFLTLIRKDQIEIISRKEFLALEIIES